MGSDTLNYQDLLEFIYWEYRRAYITETRRKELENWLRKLVEREIDVR